MTGSIGNIADVQLARLIKAHRLTKAALDAYRGEPDDPQSVMILHAEEAAARALLSYPCRSLGDLKTKISYVRKTFFYDTDDLGLSYVHAELFLSSIEEMA